MASGIRTTRLSSFGESATTSKVLSEQSGKLDSQNDSRFDSKRGDEPLGLPPLGQHWLCGCDRSRRGVISLLGRLLDNVRSRQPSGARLLFFLFRRQAVCGQRWVGGLRPRPSEAVRAAGNPPPCRSIRGAAVFPVAAAYTAWARGRLGWAGIFSGLALAKPQLLLLVPVLFLARRAWRALAGFAAVIAGLAVISIAGFGAGPVLGYVNAVGRWAIGGSLQTSGQIVYTDTAVYSLRNVLEAVPGGGKGLALAVLVILLALVALSLSWRPDKPRLDFALAIAASLVLSPHQNVHDLALLVIPGFALADLALAGELRWPRAAALVLVLAYAAINLTLALDLWSAAVGAIAIAAYLTVERMAVRPDPIPLGELRWSGPRPQRVIVLPAYRAAKTLVEVVGDIPAGQADRILLVDDASADATVSVAMALHLDVIRHQRNLGYGGNQKTCYRHALAMGADVVVMLHPDGQYDPAIIPNLCRVIEDGEADIVLGSRWLGLDPAKAGMPWWKRLGNRFLTAAENRVLGLHLSEYHTGYRAYSRRFLEAIPFLENSNDFVFDTQALIQAATFGFKIGEVPAIGKYHADASSVSFRTSTVYGLETLAALFRYVIHRAGFPSPWLTPASDADKQALAIGQVAHHGNVE